MLAYSALVDFSDPHHPQGPRLRHAFGTARQHLIAHRLDEVRPVLDAVQAASAQGLWCVGYVRYEAAPAFDAALAVHAADGPLAWFAVYEQALPWPADLGAGVPDAGIQVDWQAPLTRAELDTAMGSIQHAIAQGELYQVNFTAQMQGVVHGVVQGLAHETLNELSKELHTLGLFSALQRAQPGGYAAYINTGEHGQVLSVSPELFFDWRDGAILARPMKGTAHAEPRRLRTQPWPMRCSPLSKSAQRT